jgi:hypothetical protein
VTLPVQEPCDVNSTFGRQTVEREVTQSYNHEGTIVVACAWLAFYAIVAVHHAIVSIIGAPLDDLLVAQAFAVLP